MYGLGGAWRAHLLIEKKRGMLAQLLIVGEEHFSGAVHALCSACVRVV